MEDRSFVCGTVGDESQGVIDCHCELCPPIPCALAFSGSQQFLGVWTFSFDSLLVFELHGCLHDCKFADIVGKLALVR